MLCSCVLDFGGSWDTYLLLAKFSYNNIYNANIGMPPYDLVYGIKCWTLICCGEASLRVTASTKVVLKTIKLIQQVCGRL